METLEFVPLDGKKLTVEFIQKSERLSKEDIEHIKRLIEEKKPDFAAEELGDRTIDDFYKKDPYAGVFQDAGVLIYPVDISEYAKTSISAVVDEKRRLVDAVEASYMDEEDAEYVKAYAEALRAEYEEMREQEEISIRNDWMVKGILDCAHRVSKEDILCIFIGDAIHWDGMMELLRSVGAEIHTTPFPTSQQIHNAYIDVESTGPI
ncbi:MAG: hypothetical protein SVM80_05470 [Halobacteriota archaeon]|nr:hypothetical protein [Halobacteriota archaeon]